MTSMSRFGSSGGRGAGLYDADKWLPIIPVGWLTIARVPPFETGCCCGSCNWTSKFEGETTSISCIPEVDKIDVRCLMTVSDSS